MKKFLLLLIFCLIPNVCFAVESVEINLGKDYILTTNNTVNSIAVGNPEIFTINPFFTIFNEKNVLLLHPQKIGVSNLTFFQTNGDVSFVITVKPSNAKLPTCFTKNGYDFSLLDSPPDILHVNDMDNIKLDPPPTNFKEQK